MMIYIVRHAWAHELDGIEFTDDASRTLTHKGRKRFACVVKALMERDFAPVVIATSPILRCRETADLIAEHLGGETPVVPLDELAPGTDLEGLLDWTAEQSGDVCWVGHSPDVGDMTAALIGDRYSLIRFGKASIAAIRFDSRPAQRQGELEWLVTPKMLGC